MAVTSLARNSIKNPFRANSMFTPPGPIEFDYLVISGGGRGGTGENNNGDGGGGGAGGYLCSVTGENSGRNTSPAPKFYTEIGQTFPVTVGAGNGNYSRFAGIWVIGGGAGADTRNQTGGSGGSGGGGPASAGGNGPGGNGTSFLGFNGQAGNWGSYGGGGGGGALENGGTDGVRHGGDGLPSSITGTSVTRAGGGGGGRSGVGGDGGGGTGGGNVGGAATVNTGSGGGGAAPRDANGSGGNGGSGIIIIKYPSNTTLTIGPGLVSSTTTLGGFKITSFTAGSDTVTVN